MSVRRNANNNHALSASYTQRDSAGPSASMTALGKLMGMFQAPDPNVSVVKTDWNDPQEKLQLAREILFMIATAENDVKVEARKKEEALRSLTSKLEPTGSAVQTYVSRTQAERVKAERTSSNFAPIRATGSDRHPDRGGTRQNNCMTPHPQREHNWASVACGFS